MLTEQEWERATKETDAIAEKHSNAEVGELAWKLVRYWKNFENAQPAEFDPLVRLVAETFTRPLADLENAVDYAWDMAKTPDVEDIFSEAILRATEKPIELPGDFRESFRTAASIIYYISVQNNGKPFHVPAEKLGKVLGFSDDNQGDGVRKIVQRMVKHKLLTCVDGKYVPHVKCKLYRWTENKSHEDFFDIPY